LQAKSTGMGRSNLKSVAWSVLIQSNGEDVLTRYFCHIKDFRADFHNPKITSYEGYRTVHKKDGSTDYMWGRYKNTDGAITRTDITVGILRQKRFIREMLSCITRICQMH
jgi:outer membrane phospholipase A